MKKLTIFLIAIFILILVEVRCQNINIEGHKQNIIILGKKSNTLEPNFIGTAFLVKIEDIFYLVTAKHVIVDLDSEGNLTNVVNDSLLYAAFYNKKEKVEIRYISEIKSSFNVDWIFHNDKNVDIAMIPFAVDIQHDKLRVIPETDFLDTKSLFETYDIYFISFQPGLTNFKYLSPIFRSGTIARINKDGTFYIDAFAFPGNSGSPLFLKSSFKRYDSNTINIGGDPIGGKFLGIVGAYLPYRDIAISLQTKKPRVIFEENTGLAKIWSVDFIKEIITAPNTINQIQNIKKNYSNK